MARYKLVVMAPDTLETPIGQYESDLPFLSIQRGELINSSTLNVRAPDTAAILLEVTNVEHQIFGSPPTHSLFVFTRKAKTDLKRWPEVMDSEGG